MQTHLVAAVLVRHAHARAERRFRASGAAALNRRGCRCERLAAALRRSSFWLRVRRSRFPGPPGGGDARAPDRSRPARSGWLLPATAGPSSCVNDPRISQESPRSPRHKRREANRRGPVVAAASPPSCLLTSPCPGPPQITTASLVIISRPRPELVDTPRSERVRAALCQEVWIPPRSWFRRRQAWRIAHPRARLARLVHPRNWRARRMEPRRPCSPCRPGHPTRQTGPDDCPRTMAVPRGAGGRGCAVGRGREALSPGHRVEPCATSWDQATSGRRDRGNRRAQRAGGQRDPAGAPLGRYPYRVSRVSVATAFISVCHHRLAAGD